MQIANDTEDDVLYTIDDPGDPQDLSAGCFREESALQEGSVVRFFLGAEEVASSSALPSDALLVLLRRELLDYKISLLTSG